MRDVTVKFDIGTKVWLNGISKEKHDWIPAIVSSIIIDKIGIRYICTWFHNGERKEDRFIEEELSLMENQNCCDHSLKIGFHRGNCSCNENI